MKMLKRLEDIAQKEAVNRTVVDVRIGLCYTAILLDNGSAGLAYTFSGEGHHGCCSFQGARPLAGKKAIDLISYATSPDLLERTVAIATANALINKTAEGLVEADSLEILDPGKEDIVGMVGCFVPLVAPLKTKAAELFIFEKNTGWEQKVYPEEKAYEILPTCSIAIITSTALINGTLDRLLEASKNCSKVMLLGPSTPLSKEMFKPFKVDLLSGVVITEAHSIIRIVSEGGGMRGFKGYIKKVNLQLLS
jgi:uncharacterized protein